MKKLLPILILFTSISLSAPFVKPSEPHGMLIFNVSHATQDVFPVTLY